MLKGLAGLDIRTPCRSVGRTAAVAIGFFGIVSPYSTVAATYGTSDTPASFAAAADRSQEAITRCGAAAAACVAQELDHYADWIESVAPQLPPELHLLPTIVRQAASGVRAAKSRHEAVRAVEVAIAEVRKSIKLLRIDDPDVRETATREVSLSVETLSVASAKLEKATDL
jgi:hypothetical protein